jgi:hypothetical protein
MKTLENHDEFADVLTSLTEAGLVDIVLGDDGKAGFTLSAAITAEGPDAIAALLAGIEAITGPHHRP